MDGGSAGGVGDLPTACFAITYYKGAIFRIIGNEIEQGLPNSHRDGIFLGFISVGAGDATTGGMRINHF